MIEKKQKTDFFDKVSDFHKEILSLHEQFRREINEIEKSLSKYIEKSHSKETTSPKSPNRQEVL